MVARTRSVSMPVRVPTSFLFAMLASLPFLFGFFTLAGSWVPPLDDAYIALRTSDVFTQHVVLSGQRSTAYFDAGGMQVHHPGPLENYLLAIPYALSGFHAWGLLLGDLLVITGCLWIAITVCMRVWRPVWALLPISAVWDDFCVSTEPRHGSVKLTFQYATPGGATPHAPAKSVVLWQGLLPGYGPVPESTVVISTTSLS